MILQELHKLAEAEKLIGDPAFEIQRVSWLVHLDPATGGARLENYQVNRRAGEVDKKGQPVKAAWVGRHSVVPTQPGRTSGDLAFFAVDKAEYALGFDPAGKRPKPKLRTRLDLFRAPIRECAKDTGDAGAEAVADLLERVRKEGLGELIDFTAAETLEPNHMLAFRVGDTILHEREAVRDWWRARHIAAQEAADETDQAPRPCLVTGTEITAPPLVPQIKSVPGGSAMGVALISFNNPAYESYGQSGNENAPLSAAAARGVSAALNRLLAREPINSAGERLDAQRIDLSADTTMVYWSSDPAGAAVIGRAFEHAEDHESAETDIDPMSLFDKPAEEADADPHHSAIKNDLRRIWSGRAPEAEPERLAASFHAVTLGGTQGRVILRDWFEAALGDTLANLAAHFADTALVRRAKPGKGKPEQPTIPLREALDALAPPGRGGAVPPALAGAIIRAALRGPNHAYPRTLLSRILLRERAEAGGDDWKAQRRRDARLSLARGAVLRGAPEPLRRAARQHLTPALNRDWSHPAYLCGRAMALIEKTQAATLSDDTRHAPLTDRFLRSAMATPAHAFPAMLRLFQHHLNSGALHRATAARWPGAMDPTSRDLWRIRADGPLARLAEQQMCVLLGRLEQFPERLGDAEQAVFLLGRHQQHEAFFTKPQPDPTP